MTEPLLSARDLRIGFGGVIAADGVNLEVPRGERLAIIGPNGAGKTTFCNICTGYLKPMAGSVRFDGRTITNRPPRDITRLGIGRAFQVPQLFINDTALDNMLLAVAARDRSWQPWRKLGTTAQRGEMRELLRLLGVEHAADRIVRELPEGTRKLIDIALALALSPKLLVMDEPTSGVSTADKFEVMETLMRALEARGMTTIFVEHDMDIVRMHSDRVVVWTSGKIFAEGAPNDVLNDPRVISTVIGV
jgi:branched-chain amino acid transport system ATP-binding protein